MAHWGVRVACVVRLYYLMFTKKQRLPEWQRIMASLYRNHLVVVGVGRVSLQVVKGLLAVQEHVVAIDQSAGHSLIDELHEMKIPVISGELEKR